MLHVFEPNIGQAEIAAVTRTLAARRISPGERVAEFEAMLCAETGAKHAICCNSGTTALMLAMIAHNGTVSRIHCRVSVPSYGFAAAANAAGMAGFGAAVGPPFTWCDTLPIDGVTCCAKPLEEATQNSAVFISHNGQATGWRGFSERCVALGVSPIHDAATSIGLFRLRPEDNAIHTLSFSGPKLVGAGQGGALLSNAEWWAERARALVDHGGGAWRTTRVHEDLGGNFRMADLNAALGIAQMQRLPELLGIRRERFTWYREHFPDMPPDGWCALVRSTKAHECIAALSEAGYEALQPYRPVQESLPYRDNPIDPEAVKAADELLYLPVHWMARPEDINVICETILKVDPCARGN